MRISDRNPSLRPLIVAGLLALAAASRATLAAAPGEPLQAANQADLARADIAQAAASSPRSIGDLLRAAYVDSETLHAQGLAALEAGAFDEAVKLLRRAVARRPENAAYLSDLADAMNAAGDRIGATWLLEDAQLQFRDEHRVGDPTIATALARLQLLEDDPAAALSTLSSFEQELPPSGALLLAETCNRTGQLARRERVLREAVERAPRVLALREAYVRATLDRGRTALALRRIRDAEAATGGAPTLDLLAAEAYLELDELLGDATVRSVPGGRAGQFHGQWLLVEQRKGIERFLCAPPASALYRVRRALDGGVNTPAAHLLHARIWYRLDRSATAWQVIEAQAAALLRNPTPETLQTFSSIALASNHLDEYLVYTRMLANQLPDRRDALLTEMYVTAAERLNLRGEDGAYRALLARALELAPERVDLRLRLADAFWDAERFDDALTNYRLALQRVSDARTRARVTQRMLWLLQRQPVSPAAASGQP